MCIAVFASFSKVTAQQTIDLDEAVTTALNNSTSVSTIENSLRIQGYNTESSQGDLFPSLTLSGGWSRTHTSSKGGTFIQNGIPISVGDQNSTTDNFNLRLNSQLTLFNGFANYETVDLNDARYDKLKLDLEKARRDVILSVNQSFFAVLKNEKIVQINQDNLADARLQLERIVEFKEVGKSTMVDVYRQEVQVAQNELDVERSINNLKKSKVDLMLAMNDDLDRDYNVSSAGINAEVTVSDLKLVLDQSNNTEVLVQRAINNRYDYKAILEDIKVKRMELDIAGRSIYYPTVSAFGDYNLSGRAIDDITNTKVASYGISLSYPIFVGFDLQTNREIAEVNLKQRAEDLDYLELQIKAEIKKSILDLETAYKQAEILEKNIRSAEQDKILSEENYRVGLGTLLDVQVATTALNNLRIQQVTAIYDFLIAKRQLDYYVGVLTK